MENAEINPYLAPKYLSVVRLGPVQPGLSTAFQFTNPCLPFYKKRIDHAISRVSKAN
jgi:hypothetical protein